MTVQQSSKIRTATGSSFTIRQANLTDVESLLAMLKEAAVWMEENGITQWSPGHFKKEEVESYFGYRTVYMVLDEEVPAGMFTLQDTDPDYWKSSNEQGYYYLHRLTVRGPYRSQKLGSALLDWVSEKCKLDQMKGLRLDCRASNEKLNEYYQKLGFVYKGVAEKGGSDFCLYER